MINIRIKTIDHNQQRYSTVGDYFYNADGSLQIFVSNLGSKKMEMLVAFHEIVEQLLTEEQGVNEEAITNFDIYYEKRREQGLVEENSEPGFDPSAPYKIQHTIATGFELILAGILGVDWKEYELKINSL